MTNPALPTTALRISQCTENFFQSGLPDGIFSNQKYHFGLILEGLLMVYFMSIWNILLQFGIFYGNLVIFGNLVYFSPFWYIVSRKIWQP
jgi:hypothetical protein